MVKPEISDFRTKDIFAVIEPRCMKDPARVEHVIVSRHEKYDDAVIEATIITTAKLHYTYVVRLLSIVELK